MHCKEKRTVDEEKIKFRKLVKSQANDEVLIINFHWLTDAKHLLIDNLISSKNSYNSQVVLVKAPPTTLKRITIAK